MGLRNCGFGMEVRRLGLRKWDAGREVQELGFGN